MLLRVSGELSGQTVDLSVVTASSLGDGGVPAGELLCSFTDAVVKDDSALLPQLRGQLVEQVGPAGLVDAAATIATFSANDRVSNATGIPLDQGGAEQRREIAAELHIEDFELGD